MQNLATWRFTKRSVLRFELAAKKIDVSRNEIFWMYELKRKNYTRIWILAEEDLESQDSVVNLNVKISSILWSETELGEWCL